MVWLSELGRRFWMLSHRRQFDADFEEEIRLHFELREQNQMQAGLAPAEARHRALRQFGNEMSLREKSHMGWGWQWLEHILQDVNYGLRAMLAQSRHNACGSAIPRTRHWREYSDF